MAELLDREPIFHRRHHGTSSRDLSDMMDDGFWEIGASGRIYDRNYVVETCLDRYRSPEMLTARPADPRLRRLAYDLWHLSYDLHEDGRSTRRSTIWRRDGSNWRIVFHQGTVIT